MTEKSTLANLLKLMSTRDFSYNRRVHFYETDMMGVVHHSNYLRYFEEARMAWLQFCHLHKYHTPHLDITLAVLHTACFHYHPVSIDQILTVRLQIRLQGLRVIFQYQGFTDQFGDKAVVTGESTHVPLNKNLKVRRLPIALKAHLEKEPWNETWLLNL